MSKQVRLEVTCVIEGDGVANDLADKLSDYMEECLEIDCSIVIIDTETEEEIDQ